MDKEEVLAGNNGGREDVRWLLSLSESELDLLISLRKLVMRRAQNIGHEALANKFSLKKLRVLGFIVMQHVNKQVKDMSVPGLSVASKLLSCESTDNVKSKESDNLEMDLLTQKRKRKIPGSSEHSSPKRQKSEDSEILEATTDGILGNFLDYDDYVNTTQQ